MRKLICLITISSCCLLLCGCLEDLNDLFDRVTGTEKEVKSLDDRVTDLFDAFETLVDQIGDEF